MKTISFQDRCSVHESFWSLNDGKKYHFYSKHVERAEAKRKRTKNETTKKHFTYTYWLTVKSVKTKVCREFFLNTLNINKGRILYFFKKNVSSTSTEVPRSPWSGRHKKKEISEVAKEEVRKHILKFPTVESHYCRANSSKKYLEKELNLSQMFRLYISEVDNPVKFSAYRSIFDFEFNLSFEKPKKDMCDKCIVGYNNENTANNDPLLIQHIINKQEAKNERDVDLKNINDSVGIICFDLQNVFQLPVANASNIFYRRKFSLFNLTACLNRFFLNRFSTTYINYYLVG